MKLNHQLPPEFGMFYIIWAVINFAAVNMFGLQAFQVLEITSIRRYSFKWNFTSGPLSAFNS